MKAARAGEREPISTLYIPTPEQLVEDCRAWDPTFTYRFAKRSECALPSPKIEDVDRGDRAPDPASEPLTDPASLVALNEGYFVRFHDHADVSENWMSLKTKQRTFSKIILSSHYVREASFLKWTGLLNTIKSEDLILVYNPHVMDIDALAYEKLDVLYDEDSVGDIFARTYTLMKGEQSIYTGKLPIESVAIIASACIAHEMRSVFEDGCVCPNASKRTTISAPEIKHRFHEELAAGIESGLAEGLFSSLGYSLSDALRAIASSVAEAEGIESVFDDTVFDFSDDALQAYSYIYDELKCVVPDIFEEMDACPIVRAIHDAVTLLLSVSYTEEIGMRVICEEPDAPELRNVVIDVGRGAAYYDAAFEFLREKFSQKMRTFLGSMTFVEHVEAVRRKVPLDDLRLRSLDEYARRDEEEERQEDSIFF